MAKYDQGGGCACGLYLSCVCMNTLDPSAPLWYDSKVKEQAKKEVEKMNKLTGGPSRYYDYPFSEWKTSNDMMEHLAKESWKEYSLHFKDIFKALCRWGRKDGTELSYDAEKMIYSATRVLRMLVGTKKTREYLQRLLDDPQFKE